MAVTPRALAAGAPRAAPAPSAPVHPARLAYGAYLAFVVGVYSSLPQLVPAADKLAPGKTLIGLAAVALAWSCVLGRRPFVALTGAGTGALFLFFGLVALSPLWSDWPIVSAAAAAEAVKYVVAVVVAINVIDSRARLRRAAVILALATLFPALGALHGYVTGARLVEGTRAVWLGVFGNPNFLAYHLVVSVPIALALRDSVPAGSARRGLVRLVWLAVVGVLAVAVLVTGSRGGTLGLAAVLLLWLARGLARGRLALGAAVAVSIALVMTPGGPWDRAETHTTLSGEVDASARGRLDAWRTALRVVEAEPVGGVGVGAFMHSYDRWAPGDAGPALTAHNSFVMVAAEVGLPALAFFAAALVGAVRALTRAARRVRPEDAVLARGVQIALFGFLVCSLTGGYAFTWPLYFALGLAAALVRVVRPRPAEAR